MKGSATAMLLAGSLLLATAGCPSFATLKTARALDKGELQVTAAASFEYFSAPSGTFSLPEVETTVRYGFADRFDLGLRLSTAGHADIESTIQLLRGRLDLALAPSVGVVGIPGEVEVAGYSWFLFPITLPLLAGVNFGRGHQLVFGPKLYAIYYAETGPAGDGDSVSIDRWALDWGALLGVSFKVGSSRLMPEVDLLVPFPSNPQVPSGLPAGGLNGPVTPGGYAVSVALSLSGSVK